MVVLRSILFTFLVSDVTSRVIRRSYGDRDAEQKPSSGYYFPDNAPDITKDDYGSQVNVASNYDGQQEVTASNQGIASDWRPETPPPPPSDGVLPNREYFTLIPQTPDTDYPTPEWEGEERTTKVPVTTTESPRTTTTARPWWETTTQTPWWETTTVPSTTTTRPWWETTTTQRPWWETTDRPWWETTTTQRPWWETSSTQRPWWETTTQRPSWTTTTALPWWLTTTKRPGRYYVHAQSEQARRLPIPRRSSRECRMLNPQVDGKSHPKNDESCIQEEVIQPGCSCRYLRGENDENGCALYFLTLCTRR